MAKTKGVQVSATISPELHAALEDHRWTVRKTMTELVRMAVEEYADNHDVHPTEFQPATLDDEHEDVAAE
jgi:hypothetical protein